MSPAAISVLMHHYLYNSNHPRIHIPDIKKEQDFLIKHGFVKKQICLHNDYFYFVTEKGQVYVRLLCLVSWPKQIWVDSDGNKIDI